MTLSALASPSDLAVRLGVTIAADDPRALALLADVSAAIRGYTGSSFASAPTTAAVRPYRGRLKLPTGPVSAVASVVDANGSPVGFTWTRGRTITLADFYRGWSPLTVAYTAGWTVVPDDIKAVACQIAGRAWGTNAAEGANSQEQLGLYSVTTGTIAAAGPLGLLDAERETLDRYRRTAKPSTIDTVSWIQPSWPWPWIQPW